MKVLCVFGQYNYGLPSRGESHEYSNFIPALRRLGHQVYFFESLDKQAYRDYKELNRALLEYAEEILPDLIITVPLLYEIWTETWQILRDWGKCAMVLWTTDDSWKYPQSSRFLAKSFHAVTTTYPDKVNDYIRDGIRHVKLTQWAANSETMKEPMSSKECKYEVTFVGSATPYRKAMIEFLSKINTHVICFGFGWPNGPVESAKIPEIVRNSVISINFSRSINSCHLGLAGKRSQIKARTFEIPGAGGFLLSEWTKGIGRFYKIKSEIEVFHNVHELARLIDFYRNHPKERDEIANKGYLRTRADHTYDQRMSEIIEFAKREFELATKNKKGHRIINWSRLRHAEEMHKLGGLGKLFKSILLIICDTLWGKERGSRAARRLVFEISWRLMGEITYSSRGLPGRMFYRE